ncbi:long-chain-fatty-acid--AMP ligase [Salix suchowensis]|nr:long-chain-fatty-acid--AMP ligase [Salix suchowensis]
MIYENYDPSFPDQPVVDLYLPVWANLPSFRSKPGFIWAEDGSNGAAKSSTIIYAQLNESAHSISTRLLTQLQRGDTVVILCSPGLELVQIIFGCHRAGLLCIPMFPPDPSFTKENHHHLVRVLSQTKPKAAIAQHDYIARKLTWISTSDIKDKKGSSNMGSLPYNGCRPNELYLIQYTSGATVIPKPVMVTAGAAAHNVRVARKAYDLYPNTVIVSWLPRYLDCGVQFLLLTIISGATSVLTSGAFWAKPIMHFSILSSYGLAENGTFVSTAWRGNCSNGESFPHIPSHNKLLPCARLASQREEEEDMDIIVVDEDTCELVVDGMEGEIWVSSPSNYSGYLGHPSITREIFQARLREQGDGPGKIQRWAAKDMLIRDKMSVVMEMQFEDNNARFFPSFEATEQVKFLKIEIKKSPRHFQALQGAPHCFLSCEKNISWLLVFE